MNDDYPSGDVDAMSDCCAYSRSGDGHGRWVCDECGSDCGAQGYPFGADCDTDAIKADLGRMLPTLAKVNEAFIQLAGSLYDPATSPQRRGDGVTGPGGAPTSKEKP